MFDHFKSIYGEDENSTGQEDRDLHVNPEQVVNEEVDAEISLTEIKKCSFCSKNNKSTGTDQICAEILKASFDIVSTFLFKLYNRLFLNAEYPRLWGEGFIVPIFKGGCQDESNNFRGKILINIMGKINSQILLNRLNKWEEEEEKILDNQYGFQKGKSTVDCIFTFYSIIAKTLFSKEKIYFVFIDYEKAFDKVDKSFLRQKLVLEKVSS